MLLKPLTQTLGSGPFLWLALAMSSTLAGNLTLIGSVANLIVVQQARKRVEIGFMEYFRVGALITAVTIADRDMRARLEVQVANGAETVVAEKLVNRPTSATISSSDTRTGSQTFAIVLFCGTDEEKTRGLQGFRRLRPDEAALFTFDPPADVTFWMGSVAFPIDIVFIAPDKKVIKVYRNCKPGSRDLYPSDTNAAWVLETAAGSGIRVNDSVRFQ